RGGAPSVLLSPFGQVGSEGPRLVSSAHAVPTKTAAPYRPEPRSAEDVYVQAPPHPDRAAPETVEPEAATEPSLEQVLGNLNAFFGNVTSAIPGRFNFTEGDSGFAIEDGGNDMYDSGNYLSTSNGGPIAYTNGAIVP